MEAMLLSREDAAAVLGLGRRTIDGLIARGELRIRRVGRRVLIPRKEVERFAAARDDAKVSPNRAS
jgi:excisionase family DNA binding protein